MLVLAAAGAILAAGLDLPAPVRLIPVLVAGVAAARALASLVRAVARWQRQVLVVTDRRALLLAGGLGQRAAIVPLGAISDIEIVCPAAGRVLHYGGVVVCSGERRGLCSGSAGCPTPTCCSAFSLAWPRTAPRPRGGRPPQPLPARFGSRVDATGRAACQTGRGRATLLGGSKHQPWRGGPAGPVRQPEGSGGAPA